MVACYGQSMTATVEPIAESRPDAPSWHTRAFALALVALVLYANREPHEVVDLIGDSLVKLG